MEKSRILVVDDESLIRDFLKEMLIRIDCDVDLAENGSSALEKIQNDEYDLIVTDIRMPDISGMEVLKEAKKIQPDTEVIMITAYGTIENAVEAMKIGAYNYIEKDSSPKAPRCRKFSKHCVQLQ